MSMNNNLDESLRYISNLRKVHNTLGDPFADDVREPEEVVIYNKPKKRKKSLSEKIRELDTDLSENLSDYDLSFDMFIDDGEYDEDRQLKDRLIGYGRKYAREHSMDEDKSEINKAFAPQEKALDDLYNEIESDKKNITEDITKLRGNGYGANKKALADLVSAKNTMHSTALSILKEKSAINKTKFELKTKIEGLGGNKSGNDEDAALQASSALQQILGVGHDNLLSSVGGRSGSSGAYFSESDYNDDDLEYNDDIIRNRYGLNEEETDGDKFLKYEGTKVNLILNIDEYNGTRYITAEDDDGNSLDDYPVPQNVYDLKFDIDSQASIATDNLNREYIVRKYESV